MIRFVPSYIIANARGIPKGYRAIEAYSDGTRVVIPGVPATPEDGIPDDLRHNCDALGCGLDHVILRTRLPEGDTPFYGEREGNKP